jgi:GPH family glycoside/pentoside/hexuronide:cation symporter
MRSLTAVMTSDPDERNSIASYRQIFANSAGFIVQSLAIPMVAYLGRGNDARGYQLTMGLLSVLSVVFFIIAFFSTKERIQPDPQQKSSLGQDLSDLFGTVPGLCSSWRRCFISPPSSFAATSCCPISDYVSPGTCHLFSWFNGFGLAALLVGVACSTAVTRRVGKRQLFIASMILSGPFSTALFSFRRTPPS